MRTISTLCFIVVAFTGLQAQSGEKKKGELPFEVFNKGYFVKNTVKLDDNPAFLIFADKKAYDETFGVGFVMGAKPNLVKEGLFEKNVIVTMIKSGKMSWRYEVESVKLDKKQLVVRFSAKGMESATATFNSPLIVSVPRGDYTEVVFMEGAKEAGKVAVKK